MNKIIMTLSGVFFFILGVYEESSGDSFDRTFIVHSSTEGSHDGHDKHHQSLKQSMDFNLEGTNPAHTQSSEPTLQLLSPERIQIPDKPDVTLAEQFIPKQTGEENPNEYVVSLEPTTSFSDVSKVDTITLTDVKDILQNSTAQELATGLQNDLGLDLDQAQELQTEVQGLQEIMQKDNQLSIIEGVVNRAKRVVRFFSEQDAQDVTVEFKGTKRLQVRNIETDELITIPTTTLLFVPKTIKSRIISWYNRTMFSWRLDDMNVDWQVEIANRLLKQLYTPEQRQKMRPFTRKSKSSAIQYIKKHMKKAAIIDDSLRQQGSYEIKQPGTAKNPRRGTLKSSPIFKGPAEEIRYSPEVRRAFY